MGIHQKLNEPSGGGGDEGGWIDNKSGHTCGGFNATSVVSESTFSGALVSAPLENIVSSRISFAASDGFYNERNML